MKDWLSYRAKISARRPAVVSSERTLNYEQLDAGVRYLAGQLKAAGIMAGHNVAILPANTLETIFAIHAVIRIGAVLVPLNLRLPVQALNSQIEFVNCEWLLYTDQHSELANSIGRVPSIRMVRRRGHPWIEAENQGFRVGPISRDLSLDTLAAIVFTSGSTAGPRGVMLSYGNLYWSAIASALRLEVRRNDRWLACLPLYHMGGLSIVFRACLYGTALILVDGFDPDQVDAVIRTEKATQISLIPTLLYRFLENGGGALNENHVRFVLVGGAAAPLSLLEDTLALEIQVAATYGLTETTSQVATARPEEVRQKPGSVGKPLMFTEIRVVNADGQETKPGEIGEILVRGPTVMQGYYGQEELTARSLDDGVLHTGDVGYKDVEGDLWVQDRREDLIISGGENISPTLVEQVLTEHPDVAQACVLGVRDDIWGERVAAAIRVTAGRTPTTEELIAHCREKLAGFQIPREFTFVEQFPLTGSGKLDRAAVRLMLTGESEP